MHTGGGNSQPFSQPSDLRDIDLDLGSGHTATDTPSCRTHQPLLI